MNEQLTAIIIAGILIVAFGGLASYMADRQHKQAKKSQQDKQKARHSKSDQLGHAGT